MSKADLPPETRKDLLKFEEVISMVGLIDGEIVIVSIRPLSARWEDYPNTVSLIGELQHQSHSGRHSHEYSIGTPYPEKFPDHLAGGVLFLDKDTFEHASIRTYDGNDYFAISITTRHLEILIQDSDSTST